MFLFDDGDLHMPKSLALLACSAKILYLDIFVTEPFSTTSSLHIYTCTQFDHKIPVKDRLTINFEKTEFMIISNHEHEVENSFISIGQNSIQSVKHYISWCPT